MTLEDQAVRAIINGATAAANRGLQINADQCVSVIGTGAAAYVNQVQHGTRMFLKASGIVAHAQRELLGADNAGRPSVYYVFPVGWLPGMLQLHFNANHMGGVQPPATWTGLDGAPR